jgi:hypothetical protein
VRLERSDNLPRMRLMACLLLLSTAAFAAKHAPLSDVLIAAKTVYIVNETGDQDVTDGAYDGLTKWGRFTLVKSRTGADLVLVFKSYPRIVQGTTRNAVGMSVFAPSSEDALYEDIPRAKFHLSYAGVSKDCIADFRKRLEKN